MWVITWSCLSVCPWVCPPNGAIYFRLDVSKFVSRWTVASTCWGRHQGHVATERSKVIDVKIQK